MITGEDVDAGASRAGGGRASGRRRRVRRRRRPHHRGDPRGRARPAARARLRRRRGSSGSSTRTAVPARWCTVQIRARVGRAPHRRGARTSDHIIGSSLVFNVYARFNGDNSFQAGTYDLHTNLGVRDAVHALKARPAHQLRSAHGPARPVAPADRGPGRQAPGPQRAARSCRARATTRCDRASSRPACRTSKGWCGPTPTRSRTRRTRSRSCRRWCTAFDTHAKRLGLSDRERRGPRRLPDHDRRLDDRGRGQGAAGPAADRVGDLQPARARTCRSQIDSTRDLRAGQARTTGTLSPADLHRSSRRTTRTSHTGLPPTPIGSVSDASLLAAMHPAHTDVPLLRARRQGRPPRVRVHVRAAAAEHRGGQGGRPAVITGATRVAGVIGDPVRHSLSPRLHNAAYRRARPRLGVRRVRGSRRAARAPRSTRRGCSASSACRSRCRTRPRWPSCATS